MKNILKKQNRRCDMKSPFSLMMKRTKYVVVMMKLILAELGLYTHDVIL